MIGERLKDLRSARKLTMLQIAEDIGTTQMTYSRYERNIIDVSTEMLSKFADYYNVSVDYLLGREAPTPPTLRDILDNETRLDPFEKAFIALYIKSSDSARTELVNAIKQAVKDSEQADIDDLTADNIIMLPLHIGKVSAGTGFDLPELDDMDETAFINTKNADKADFVLQIDGDSMLPKFCDGDYILIKKADCIDYNKIGVYRFQGKGYIKQQKDGYIHSLNSDYDDIYPTVTDDIIPVGVVLGTVEIAHK